MAEAANLIEKKVKAFAQDITKFLEDKRKAKIAELKKKASSGGDGKKGGGPDDTLVTVTFAYSSGKGSVSRSPEQQAEGVSNGKSWTCAGAHMVDKARHVKMLYGPPGKAAKTSWDVKNAFGTKDQHFVTLADLKKEWTRLMKKHGLKNYRGGDGWGDGDAFHFELPESKVPRSDKRVQACLAHYAKITRLDGKPINETFEKGSWKKDLEPHLKKIEKEQKKREDAARREELAKLRFDGSAAGSVSLMKGANKAAAVAGKPFPEIDVVGPIDTGKRTAKKVEASAAIQWDSLARDIFETLGLLETKGYDVKLSCGVVYEAITYENLTQTFLTGLTPKCTLIYNTPAAKAMGMTVTAVSDVAMKTSSKAPSGTVAFRVELKSPVNTTKAEVIVAIDGAKAIAKTKGP